MLVCFGDFLPLWAQKLFASFHFLPVVTVFLYIHSCLLCEQLTKSQAFRGKVSWPLGRTKTFSCGGQAFLCSSTSVKAADSISANLKRIWKLNSPNCGVTEVQGFIFILLSLRLLMLSKWNCMLLYAAFWIVKNAVMHRKYRQGSACTSGEICLVVRNGGVAGVKLD